MDGYHFLFKRLISNLFNYFRMAMAMKYTRKQFLKLSGLSAAATAVQMPAIATAHFSNSRFRLGLASYSLRSFTLADVIKMTQRLGLTHLALKSMHMPLESPGLQIKMISNTIAKAGLKLYGAGVIYMKTRQEVEKAFVYAKQAGLEMIIGVPNHELLPEVEAHVKKYNIRLAIHNHGPGDELYASPDDVFAKVGVLDQRIGLCIDVGHVVRIAQDPIVMINKYKDRLFDVHMKDVDKTTAEGSPVEIGRGLIDIPGILKALNEVGYSQTIAFEYEKDEMDPLPGLAESVGYVRGVIKTLGI